MKDEKIMFDGLMIYEEDMNGENRELTVNFLRGDFGKTVFEEYMREISRYDAKTIVMLNSLGYHDFGSGRIHPTDPHDKGGLISGNGAVTAAIVNGLPSVQKEGLHSATLRDLEFMRRMGDPLLIRGNFMGRCGERYSVDAGLLFPHEPKHRDDDWNGIDYIEHRLAGDIREKTGKEPQYPLMINNGDVRCEVDGNSPCGITLRLSPDAQIYGEGVFKQKHGKQINTFLEEMRKSEGRAPDQRFYLGRDVDPETGFPLRWIKYEEIKKDESGAYKENYIKFHMWDCLTPLVTDYVNLMASYLIRGSEYGHNRIVLVRDGTSRELKK